MKILHVIQRYWPYTGGSERHLQEISERLARRGHEVTVFTTDALDLELFWNPNKSRIAERREFHNGVEIVRFPVRHLPGRHLSFGAIRRSMALLATFPANVTPALRYLANYVPWVPDLTDALEHLAPDYAVIHGMNICFESLLLPAYAAAWRRQIPFLLTPLIHLGESDRSLVRRFYTMPHQLSLIGAADAVLAQTPIEIDYLTRHGVAAERLVQAGVGVNPEDVLGGDGERFRQASGVRGPFVLYLGTSAYDKGTVHLVEAMRRIWSEGGSGKQSKQLELVLAGQVLDPFRAYLATLPAADRARVHLLGYVSEDTKRDLLDACALMAMPSRTDSFGIVYLESWLYRRPVIGARAGGVPAIIDDRSDGYLVEFGDVADLKRRIVEIVENPALAQELADRGHDKVLRRYTWDRIYPVVEEVYKRLCPAAMVR